MNGKKVKKEIDFSSYVLSRTPQSTMQSTEQSSEHIFSG